MGNMDSEYRTTRACLRALANWAGVGVACIATDGALLDANDRACTLLGAASLASLRASWEKTAADLELHTENKSAARLMELPKSAGRLRVERRPCEGGSILLLKDAGTLNAIDRDILLATQIRLQRFSLAAWIHDTSGSLNNLQLTIELLAVTIDKDATGAADRRGRHVSALKQEAGHLAQQLQLLQPSGQLHDPPRDVDLRTHAQSAFRAFRQEAATRRVRFAFGPSVQPVVICGDGAALGLAVLSLTATAISSAAVGSSAECTLSEAHGQAILSFLVRPARVDLRLVRSDSVLPVHDDTGANFLYAARLVLEAHGGTLDERYDPAQESLTLVATLPTLQA
jgi:hypothetical protein